MLRILFYPTVTEADDLADVLGRIGWYLYPVLGEIESITLAALCPVPSPLVPPSDMDQSVIDRFAAARPKCRFLDDATDADLEERMPSANVVLVWRRPAGPELERLDKLLKRLPNTRHYFVDRQRSRYEGSLYLRLTHDCLPVSSASLAEESRQRFLRIAAGTRKNKVYVFGTGPSLANVVDYDFSDGDVIASNSLIRNKLLMKRLAPRYLVAADPIFHAGCSSYAADFRSELIETMVQFPDMLFFVPLRDYRIYRSFMPADLQHRVLAIPFGNEDEFILDLTANYAVRPVANILTLFLLPLASTFYRDIVVVGCDGRPMSANDYFWGHDPASQFNDKMEAIKRIHPGFFAISYEDYYLEHCRTVESLLDALEANGRKVSVLTRSYIPALRSRHVPVAIPNQPMAQVVSLNPDIINAYGHYLSYEDQIHRNLRQFQIPSFTICNWETEKGILEERPHFSPGLSKYTYRIANYSVGPDGTPAQQPPQEWLTEFETELERALTLRQQARPSANMVLYFYYGSFFHAEVLLRLLPKFPKLKALINLEWLTFMNVWEDEFSLRWRNLLKGVQREPRINLTVTSWEMQAELARRTGVTLRIAPHPSVTFSDEDFHEIRASASIDADGKGPCRVLFPGLTRLRKGYLLTSETVRALNTVPHTGRFLCIARDVRTGKEPAAVLEAAAAIERYAKLVQGVLDREGFKEFVKSGHVMVLPYQPSEFAKRTSGMIIDAMYLGIPAVVLRGTWLASVSERMGFGRVIAEPSGRAIADAVASIWDNYPEERARAIAAGGEWFKSNSWTSLTGSILALA